MNLQNFRHFSTILYGSYFYFIATLILALILFTILNSAWLGDDAQITFRQVWNFISGDGITFNFAERVQAFTHPLWFWVLSIFGFITQELFMTTIILNVILTTFSVLLLIKIEFDQNKYHRTLISPTFFLIFSWAFCDYATSGLENSLSFLLTGVLIYILTLNSWKRRIREIFLVLSLLVLNRIDYSVLFFPLVLYIIWNCRNIKLLIHAIWPGAILMCIWFGFATLYFGSPLPNTYFAKLNAGYPFDEVLLRGWIYFLSMSKDLGSVFIIASALILSLLSRNFLLICLSLGQLLYCLYMLQAGGDFMLGRYFAILVYISVGQIILSLISIKRISLVFKNLIVLGIVLTLIVLGFFDRFPFRSHLELGSRTPIIGTVDPVTHIADERSFYYFIFGLFSEHRESWPQINDQKDQFPTDYRTACGIMGGNSLTTPNIFIIDQCGLTDPLISRLPAVQVESWRIGHHFRKMPTDYGEFKLGNIDNLKDQNLTKLAQDIQLITSGPLLARNRLKAIWRINSGHYSKLDLAKYKDPSEFIPFSSNTELVLLDNWDSKIDFEIFSPIFGSFSYKYFASNIRIESKRPRESNEIEIFVNPEFSYEVYVNGNFVSIIEQIVQDKIFSADRKTTIIPLEKRTNVKSIELRAIGANYVNDTSANALFHLKVNDANNTN